MKHRIIIGIIVGYLLLHLSILGAYGLTWDFHFHVFGGGKLLGYTWQQIEPRILPYVEPDPRFAWSLPYGPIMSIPPVMSMMLFHNAWHLLPRDSAYNLPIVLWGVAGVVILYVFLKQAFSVRVAALAALFLAFLPRYFGDMHNNMKDIPSAVVFALNIWVVWRLVTYKRPIDWLFAVLAFAIAFNVKINSIFIPVIFTAWVALQWIMHTSFRQKKTLTIFLSYIPLSLLAAFALWSAFWEHPVAQLFHAYRTFGIGTNNIEVLLHGAWYCSGSTVPWYYPYWYIGITTPVLLLIFFVIGLFHRSSPTKLLLLLWLFLPLSRYFIPSVGVIDGVRHFEEVLFPLAAIAAIGCDRLLHRIRPSLTRNAVILGIVGYVLLPIITYHPYQIVYFNELIGGASGAFGKYDLDYWGTSQKEAIAWVNSHAPQNAKVYIVMAADVAATYLRPDLLGNLNKYGYDDSDFVILLNRQSFYYRFFYSYEYLLAHTPAYTVSVHNTPLTWVFDNRSANKTPRKTPFWKGEDPCIIQYWKGKTR